MSRRLCFLSTTGTLVGFVLLYGMLYIDQLHVPLGSHIRRILTNITPMVEKSASSYVLQPLATLESTSRSQARSCHWPPPLYNTSAWTKISGGVLSATLYNLHVLHDAFATRDDVFFYVDLGISLGLYRDGVLGLDSDLDVRFGTTQRHLAMPAFKNVPKVPISMNDEAIWGNLYAGYRYTSHRPTQQEVTETRAKICHPQHLDAISPHLLVLDEPWQRRFLESHYGALWFVRMSWKCDYIMLTSESMKENWKTVMAVMRRMDSNSDGSINDNELQSYVQRDGGDMTQYERQLTKSQRCRAVAKANWILHNGENYKQFVIPQTYVRGDHIPFWVFPECGVRERGRIVFEQ